MKYLMLVLLLAGCARREEPRYEGDDGVNSCAAFKQSQLVKLKETDEFFRYHTYGWDVGYACQAGECALVDCDKLAAI